MAFRAAAQLVNALMSYIALARKWRPRTFSQLVGQEHINKALINSLNQQRLHHAYLFTGTRGVGKTSIARLLAKALNCERGISAEPCLQCDACLAIEQGRFIDLIEIDGASRTRVEDTRELLENVQYAPTSGRFKIYLIDEVHMLSQHSFNALLKTLEEPPAHVKFLLATTDPQKLPVTVLSRCLQFNLKPMLTDVISQHLQHILHEETLPFDIQAVELLAKAARGSMRDALSLLDQAIASSDNHLRTEDIKDILGHTRQDYALQLLQALVELAPQKLLAISREIANEGGNFHYVLDGLLSHLHQISVSQSLPNDNPLIAPEPELLDLSTRLSPEDAQLFYQIGIKGIEEIHLAPTLAIGFEMTLLRMYTFRPALHAAIPPLAYQAAPNIMAADLPALPEATASTIIAEDTTTDYFEESVAYQPPPIATPPFDENVTALIQATDKSIDAPDHDTQDWSRLLPQLKLSGLALNAAENTEFVGKNGEEVTLRVAKGHQSVFTTSVITRIEQAFADYYQGKIKLTLKSDEEVRSSPAQQKTMTQKKQQQDAETALQNDPFFQQLQQEFSAELIKNSIAPTKDDL